MRNEIKFRGKRTDNGDWVYGCLISYWRPDYARYVGIMGWKGDHYEVDPSTVGQLTGLKDRNGKEIYEGDILDCGEYHGIKEVVFMNGSYKIRGKMGQMVGFGSWANKTKVIGNVFENPELL